MGLKNTFISYPLANEKIQKSPTYHDTNNNATIKVALLKSPLNSWVLCDENNNFPQIWSPLRAKPVIDNNNLYDSDHKNESHLSWRTAKNSKHVWFSESEHPASCTHSTLFLFKLGDQQELSNSLYIDCLDTWISNTLCNICRVKNVCYITYKITTA